MTKTPAPMPRIKNTAKMLRQPRLAPGECGDAYALMQDRFQSPRARKRALALILIDQGALPDVVFRRSGVGLESQRELLHRLSSHGFQAAIFGSPRRLDQRRYDVKAIVDVLRDCLGSTPPEGTPTWNLVRLTTAVRRRIIGAEGITKETIRCMLRNELGINSIWHVDPRRLVHIRDQDAVEREDGCLSYMFLNTRTTKPVGDRGLRPKAPTPIIVDRIN